MLLIVFVTVIGLQQLGGTTANLNKVVDVHMRNQELTKTMVAAARERAMSTLMLTQVDDPFDQDALMMNFNNQGGHFAKARLALLEQPLNTREREPIAKQGRLTSLALPIQHEVTDLIVAVNLSGREFWHDTLIANIGDALAQSGLPAHAPQIELTEGIFMEDVDSAADRIRALKALGIAVSVDDLGTGYSSLAHLKRFPLDVLKIDRYFVKDLPDAPANEALISPILALCRGLGLGTVAEGIETRAQLESLRTLGCPIVQGYFISRPVPAEQIIELLGRDWLQAFDTTQQGNRFNPSSLSSDAYRASSWPRSTAPGRCTRKPRACASDLSESAETTISAYPAKGTVDVRRKSRAIPA